MRVMSVVGARPQFVKLSPMAAAIEPYAEHLIVHTGQHYDRNMSDVFFAELNIPQPSINLDVGSGKHGHQTGLMMGRLERVIESERPDHVLVYGDTNSTLAAALAAAKIGVSVTHLEAGLRSYNRSMPEEINRVLTDHASDLLLAPTKRAMGNLAAEGLERRSVEVGDVMTDVLYHVRDSLGAEGRSSKLESLHPEGYYVATLHRPQNTDNPAVLQRIISSLAQLDKPVVLLAHPRIIAMAEKFGVTLSTGSIEVQAPLGYSDLVLAVMGSAGVITDSGGLQKEAFLLRIPCTTIRPETEWVETVELGWNMLVRCPDDLGNTVKRPWPRATSAQPYGDGTAALRAVEVMLC